MKDQDQTIIGLWESGAQKYSHRPCVLAKTQGAWRIFTYADINERSSAIAHFLITGAIKPQDRIALILENSAEWVYIYLGILKASAIAVPLDPQINKEELENILRDCEAKVVFTSRKIAARADAVFKAAAAQIVSVDSQDFPRIINAAAGLNLPPATNQDIASIIYTSGTTAQPKGVCLSHKNFLSNFRSLSKAKIMRPDDNFLGLLPFYHAYAFSASLLMPLLSGAKLTIPESPSSQEILKAMQETEVTIFITVPGILNQIDKSIRDKIKKQNIAGRLLIKILLPCLWFIRKSSTINFAKVIFGEIHKTFGNKLRFIVSGGARLEPKVAADLLRFGFTVLEGYGLTETSPVVTLTPVDKIKPGSAGSALPGVEIKIVDPQDYNVNLPCGTTGEVAIKGENVMAGYFKNSELTNEVIKDGWFLSGDLGYLDEAGNLFLVGRKKEIIVLPSGKNIDPQDLEAYYAETPYIKELCILERHGLLEAVIVPNFDYFKKAGEINVRERIHWLLENFSSKLPPYKRIMGFTLAKEPLPRTHLGKLKRYQIQKDYAPEKLKPTPRLEPGVYCDADLNLLNQEHVKLIMRFLNQELKKPVYLDDHLELDLGLDSISRIEMALALEKILKIRLKEEDLTEVSTVRDLAQEAGRILKEENRLKPVEAVSGWRQTLKQVPQPQILKRIGVSLNIFDIILNSIGKIVFYFLFRPFWSLKVKGKENLAPQGPYIVTPNHASYLDSLFIYTALPPKAVLNLYFISYAIFFKFWISSWLVKPARIIPLEPGSDITLSLQISAFLLKKGKSLCIFPEGMRSIDENINEFKKGVGILSYELKVPLIPAYIKGSHFSWPRGKTLPRFYPIQVIFGAPQSPEELLTRGRQKGIADNYEAIASALRDEVIKLAQL